MIALQTWVSVTIIVNVLHGDCTYLFIYLFRLYRSLLHNIGQVSYCTLADYNKRIKLQYLKLFTIDYSS
jgi:hypothetical protein